MSLFQYESEVTIKGGTQIAAALGGSITIHQAGQASAFRYLSAAAALTALHNSSARFGAPRCHPNTRTAYVNGLEQWMLGRGGEYDSKRLIWLTGGAGAGKSAIMQSTVERCASYGVILGTFFFSRTDPTRNCAEVLIPTLAYQLACAFPTAMDVLEPIILRNPLIFKASLQTQAHDLLVQPLLYLIKIGWIDITSPLRRVFVIDGLDECADPEKQAYIIHAVAAILQDNLVPVCVLIASRPEIAITRAFERENRVHPILSITLEDNNETSSDIRRFIEDSFLDILHTHPLRASIPPNWPHPSSVGELVRKSSGHFVYAAAAMKFISSSRKYPPRELQVVEGLVSSQRRNPFAELDGLYMHILTSAIYNSQVLGILRHCVLTRLDNSVKTICIMYPDISPEDLPLFLSDVQSLVSLSPNQAGEMHILLKHASLRDFLMDVNRSGALYMPEEVYIASFLPQYFQLLDNGPRAAQLISSPTSAHDYYHHHSNVLVYELSEAITHSQDIVLLHSLIRGHSPRDIWNFVITAWSVNPDHNIRSRNAIECLCGYMRAIRDSAANHDNTLYIDQFKMFIEVLMDDIKSQVRTKPQYQILPAFMFSSGAVSCLGNVAPLLLEYFLSPRHNIDEAYSCYFLLMTTSSWYFYDRAELHPKSNEAFWTLPHAQMSWGSDLAYALELVLQHLVDYSRTPEFMRPNLHKRWLNRMKPMKHISQGSPKLSSNSHFKSCLFRRRLITRHMDIICTNPESLYAELKRYGLSRARVNTLVKRRRQCFVLLRAIIYYLHECDYTSELARLARKLLPKAALWFPGLMKRARVEMDVYIRCWEESPGGLLRKTKLLNINDMD